MSANSHAVCPRCEKKYNDELEKLRAETEAAEGHVPAEIYIRMLAELNAKEAVDFEETEDGYSIVEYYEMGVRHGKFFVRYDGTCHVCGFHHEFKHEEVIWKP